MTKRIHTSCSDQCPGDLLSIRFPKYFIAHMNIMWTADIQMKWRCDHRSCDCDLSNRKLSPKNVSGASTGFNGEPMASALALQCSTNWAMKSHTLGAGQFIEFIVPVKGMKHMNIMWTADIQMKMWSSQLWLRFQDVRANCLCATLLRRQSDRNMSRITSRISYDWLVPKIKMASKTVGKKFYSFGSSVTPIF